MMSRGIILGTVAIIAAVGMTAEVGAQAGRTAPRDPVIAAELARVKSTLRAAERALARMEKQQGQRFDRAIMDSLIRTAHRVQELQVAQTQLEQALQIRERSAREMRNGGAGQGWFGIATTTIGQSSGQSSPASDGRIQNNYYPVILSVEPGSPAERAGVRAGDRLVLLGGKDARSQIMRMGSTLAPGMVLPVRLQRGSETINMRVRIAPRPSSFSPSVSVRMEDRENGASVAIVDGTPYAMPTQPPEAPSSPGVPTPPRDRGAAVWVPFPADAPRPPEVVRAPARTLAPTSGAIYFAYSGGSTAAVAGAEVARLPADLRDALGVTRGVLVINVGRGSPAEQARLRAGDVIVRAGGENVTSPAVLGRVIREQKERSMRLEVVRRQKPIVIELAW